MHFRMVLNAATQLMQQFSLHTPYTACHLSYLELLPAALNLLNFSKDNHELASQLMLKGGCIKALHPFLISSVKLGKDKANGLRIMTPPHMHAKGVPKVSIK